MNKNGAIKTIGTWIAILVLFLILVFIFYFFFGPIKARFTQFTDMAFSLFSSFSNIGMSKDFFKTCWEAATDLANEGEHDKATALARKCFDDKEISQDEHDKLVDEIEIKKKLSLKKVTAEEEEKIKVKYVFTKCEDCVSLTGGCIEDYCIGNENKYNCFFIKRSKDNLCWSCGRPGLTCNKINELVSSIIPENDHELACNRLSLCKEFDCKWENGKCVS